MERVRLAWRDLQNDLSSFHLLKYRRSVDGFLVSSKNSGTHWARFMLSAAIAHHLGLPPVTHSSGRKSDDFIGHAKHPRVHVGAPRIGSSHNVPSRLVTALARFGLYRSPPIVLLIRDIPPAMLSYYEKWQAPYRLGSLDDYVRRPAPGVRGVDDVWWFIRFAKRWAEMRHALGGAVLVVRYEDVAAQPERWIRRIWRHWGVELNDADVAAALGVASRQAVARSLDPQYREAIVRMAGDGRAPDTCDLSALQETLERHLSPFHRELFTRPGRLEAPSRRGRWRATRPEPARVHGLGAGRSKTRRRV